MADGDYVLEARGLLKIFGNHVALDNVDFGLRAGEVHALLGENGAGKSTLIKILTGAYQPDGGGVFVDGVQVSLDNPLHAQTFGIGTVYQEVNLLPNRSVAENLFLGHQPRRFGFVDFRRMEADAKALLANYDLHIDPSSELGTHSVAVQQIVAIARAVLRNPRILLLRLRVVSRAGTFPQVIVRQPVQFEASAAYDRVAILDFGIDVPVQLAH